MRRRGRSASPSLLTPREQEVLGFLRAKLTNPEIGERLGISVETVKQHVSEILSKLSVATREEAAAWQPQPERPSNQAPWARLFAPLAMRLLGAIIVAAALAGVGVLLWFQLRSGGPSETVEVTGTPVASTTAGVSSSPAASPAPGAPAFLANVPISTLTIGADAQLPSDVSLITLLGCTGCDGPAWGVGRTYRDASGTVQVEPLLWTSKGALVGADAPTNNLGLPDPPSGASSYSVLGAASDARGGEIMAAVCCTPQTIIFRSTDGGITWSQYYSLDGEYSVYGWITQGQVLVGPYAFGSPVPYVIVPAGTEVTPPPGAETPLVADGGIYWQADHGRKLLAGNGSAYVSDSDPEIDGSYTTFYAPSSEIKSAKSAVVMYQPSSTGGASYYLATLDGHRQPTGAYLSPDSYIGLSRWLDSDHLLATASIPATREPGGEYAGPFSGFGPVIIDVPTGQVHVIAEASPAGLQSQQEILAAPPGPFVKVTGADPCLNLHAQPSIDAPVLECVANGVLLFDQLYGDNIAGTPALSGWRDVVTPDGQHGYASTAYLAIPSY